MASTYSPRLRLEEQETGSNANVWGSILNTNMIDLVDSAIAAYTTIDLTGSFVSLTTNNGAADTARSPMLLLNGTLVSNVGVIFPAITQGRWVKNNTAGAFTITLKTNAGTGYVLPQGKIVKVICDGVSVYPGTFAVSAEASLGTAALRNVGTSINELPDVSASNLIYARLSAANQFTATIQTSGLNAKGSSFSNLVTLTDAASIAVDMSRGINFVVTLGGDRVLDFPSNATEGQSGLIYIYQDAIGSRLLTYTSAWKFPGGTAPTLTTTISAADLLSYAVRSSGVVFSALSNDYR